MTRVTANEWLGAGSAANSASSAANQGVNIHANCIWTNWSYQYYATSCATASITYSNQPDFQYTTGVVTSGQNWSVWNQGWYGSNVGGIYARGVQDLDLTDQAHRQRAEEYELRLAAEVKARVEAKARATDLLVANLNSQQAEEFKTHQRFVVHSADGERKYRVEYGTAGNIKLLNEAGRAIAKFCIHPDVKCPTEDVMLAQKLMIEGNEAEFLRVANRTAIAA